MRPIGKDAWALSGKVKAGVIEFEVRFQLTAIGGEVVQGADGMEVRGADSATVKVLAATNFKDYRTVDQDPAGRCQAMIEPISRKAYVELRRALRRGKR